MDVAALNFQILAPIGFVAFGAMVVLLGEVWLSRGTGTPERVGPLLGLVAGLIPALFTLMCLAIFVLLCLVLHWRDLGLREKGLEA